METGDLTSTGTSPNTGQSGAEEWVQNLNQSCNEMFSALNCAVRDGQLGCSEIHELRADELGLGKKLGRTQAHCTALVSPMSEVPQGRCLLSVHQQGLSKIWNSQELLFS